MISNRRFLTPVAGFVAHLKFENAAFHQLTVGEEGRGIIYAIEFDGLDVAALVGKTGSDEDEILAVAQMNGCGGQQRGMEQIVVGASVRIETHVMEGEPGRHRARIIVAG